MNIRREQSGDLPAVLALVEAAFADVPESDHREQLLVARLHDTNTYVPQLSLVTETGAGKIVGYILLTRVDIVCDSGTTTPLLSIAPLAVHPCFQRRGIGGMLLKRAHERAAGSDTAARWCSVTRTITRGSDTDGPSASASYSHSTCPTNSA